jgi:hypothetical protein
MFDPKTQSANHYSDNLEVMRKLIVTAEFLLSESLEDRYVEFLRRLEGSPGWEEFELTIQDEITTYDIQHKEIIEAMENDFIKVKPLKVC